MIVRFNNRFDKDISKLDKTIIVKIFDKIKILKVESGLENIIGIRKLSGYKNFYRLRIGDYRMGFKYDNGTIILERFLHRKDIYNKFPK